MNRFVACALLCLSLLVSTTGVALAQRGRRYDHHHPRHHGRPVTPPRHRHHR